MKDHIDKAGIRCAVAGLALQGAAIALLFFAVIVLCGYLIAPAPSLAQICAKTNERGSSAWVDCVDRKVQEQRP